jgi:hypothetical protein
MHLHLPKAIHGWREFAKEVGIIVLGVLIALGFEQVVQAWRWRHDARETREALTSELEYSALWADERIAVQKCLRDRITQLTAKLHGSGTHWDADPVVLGNPRRPVGRSLQTSLPLAYRAPHRPWLSDEWQTAKSSGIIDHMARSDAHNLEFVYRNVIQLDSLQTEESSLSPQLSDAALVECRLETGRTHQVRVHMASIGHPLLSATRSTVVRERRTANC